MSRLAPVAFGYRIPLRRTPAAWRRLSTGAQSATSSASSDLPPPRARPRVSPRPSPASTSPSIAPSRRLPVNFGRNQLIEVLPGLADQTHRILKSFKAPIRYAFAYGSGVFRQESYAPDSQPMLDFIFAVSHPSHWHSINLQQNPTHYALPLRWFGSGPISWLQESGPGAGVWFNVDVEVEGRRIKYGVVSIDSLCRDLLDWETLYLAGRMQKPLHILQDDPRVRLANQVNLASALRTALLTLPETFTDADLFVAVAGLSYRGDFRMHLGENPHKVRNIVAAQLEQFRALYAPLIRAFPTVSYAGGVQALGLGEVRTLEQDVSPAARGALARKLPSGLQDRIAASYFQQHNIRKALAPSASPSAFAPSVLPEVEGKGAAPAPSDKAMERVDDEEALWLRIASAPGFQKALERGIAEVVAKPAWDQSLKGVISAGVGKSLKYIVPKLKKRWQKEVEVKP